MKSIKLIALAAALVVCCTASAQTYRSASISYAKFNMSPSGISFNLPGAAFGVAVADKLPKNAPLLYEIGVNAMYTSGSVTLGDCYLRCNLTSVMVPLNLMLELDVDKLKVLPFAGLNVMGHIAANGKYREDEGDDYVETFDCFKDEDFSAKRFQLGAQVGIKAIYDKLIFGVSYTPYLTAFWEEEGTSSTLLLASVGILF